MEISFCLFKIIIIIIFYYVAQQIVDFVKTFLLLKGLTNPNVGVDGEDPTKRHT